MTSTPPLAIGDRLEPFVDDYLIDELPGTTTLRPHQPTPEEVVLVADQPWEGTSSGYFTIFGDGDRYRMYYRGAHRSPAHREVTCYAESSDGINWSRPDLGLFEFDGSRDNNIVLDGVGTHNFTPFLDTNPDCEADARYKALGRGLRTPDGRIGNVYKLYAFKSVDAIHWTLMRDAPVLTAGKFDSQNLAFWDPLRGCYVEFHRNMRDGYRDVQTCISDDFLTWSDPVWLSYTGVPREHLYTNAIRPYERAPHILLGFPTRFFPKPLFPDRPDQTEPTFMTSRDGRSFRRWPGALIPVTAPADRTGNRCNYLEWGLVRLPHSDRELSVYATEGRRSGAGTRLRRFTFRVDGFVSVHASAAGGRLLTRPLVFEGSDLVINFATSPGGHLRAELLDTAGRALPGFSMAEAAVMSGDHIEQAVRWPGGARVARLAGKPVRLRVALHDADLYSIRFR